MKLTELFASIVARLASPPPPPDRPISTSEDVRWQRRRLEALKREADMLGIDSSLDQAGHA